MFVEKRNELAKKYNSMLKDQPISLPFVLDNIKSSFHLYIIRVDKRNKDLYLII